MDRRGFLKRAGALAVSSAFPLPAPAAPLTFKGVPLVFDECFHIFEFPTYFCIACGRAAEEIVNLGL